MADEEKKKVTRVFQMDPDTAILFFELVGEMKKRGYEDTPALRATILNRLAEAGSMQYVYDTKRTEDEIISDWQNQGLKIDDRRNYVSGITTQSYSQRVVAGIKRGLERVANFFGLGNS